MKRDCSAINDWTAGSTTAEVNCCFSVDKEVCGSTYFTPLSVNKSARFRCLHCTDLLIYMLKLFQEAAHLCVYIKDQTILIVYYTKASRSIHNKHKIIQRSLTYLLIYLLKQHIKFNKTTHKMQYIIYDEVTDDDDNLPKCLPRFSRIALSI